MMIGKRMHLALRKLLKLPVVVALPDRYNNRAA